MTQNKKDNSYKNKSSNTFLGVIVSVLVLILMLISFAAGMYLPGKIQVMEELARKEVVYLGKVLGKYEEVEEGRLQRNIEFDLYWDVWDALKSEYVDSDKISEKELFYGSLKGMVEAVDDPNTIFLDPMESHSFQESMSGSFEGIGAEVGIRDGVVTIIAPLEGMPAEKAGLKAGDKIMAINGSSTKEMSLEKAVSRIRGEEGTEVKLTIARDDLEEPKDIKVTRGVIKIESVKTELREDGIFVIKITNFNDDTLRLFREALTEVKDKNPEGIILDLRNNAGGYLSTAIEVTSAWIERDVVLIEKSSDGKYKEYKARGIPELRDYPTVVLVNMGSASASEITAGALQYHGKAVVVGEQTFGKGSVQSLVPLKDGSSLKVTVSEWLTPGEVSIDEHGIKPDMEVELSREDYEEGRTPQKDKAVEILKKLIQGETLDWEKENTKEETKDN